ncbi:Microtubule-Associated Tumor Suppressor 1 [Manis pentadactyla]|nr:Microtubule-Associated Tumor Suppressor 1 [Manis pentadactyla]
MLGKINKERELTNENFGKNAEFGKTGNQHTGGVGSPPAKNHMCGWDCFPELQALSFLPSPLNPSALLGKGPQVRIRRVQTDRSTMLKSVHKSWQLRDSTNRLSMGPFLLWNQSSRAC